MRRSCLASRPVACELPRDASRARPALQRPNKRIAPRALDLGLIDAEMLQPVPDDREVIVLLERIEAHPQPEALGERNLLLDYFARVYFAIGRVLVALVVAHVFGHQV